MLEKGPGVTSGQRRTHWLRRQQRLFPERNLQLVLALVAVVLFVSPAIAVIIGAFRTTPFDGEWALEPLQQVLSSPDTWNALWNSVVLTAASVVPGLIIATFFAVLVTRTNAALKWLITGTMAVLVATPPMFYAVAWGLLGNKTVGLLNVMLRGGELWGDGPLNIESWAGLILVSTFRGVGFMFLLLIGPFSQMDRALEEAARVSGAGPIRTFFGTQLPVLLPAISGVLIISIIASIEAFDIPVVLGVPAGIYVLPTEVFAYLYDSTRPLYGQASTVSIILLVILIVLLVIERQMHGRKRFVTITGKGARSTEWDLHKWKIPAAVLTILFALVAVVFPVVQLVIASLSPYFGATSGYSLQNFIDVFQNRQLVTTLGYTALVAAIAAALAVGVVTVMLWAARLRKGVLATLIQSSQMASMVVPGLLLGIGLVTVVLMSPLAKAYGGYELLVFGLFVSVVPLASRSIAGALAQIPFELEEANRVSGGSRFRSMFAVVFRLLIPSLLNGWLLCFVVVSGSLAIPLLLSPRGNSLLAVSVYELYVSADIVTAAALFVLFVIEVLVVAIIVEVLKRVLTLRKTTAPVIQTPSATEWTGAVGLPSAKRLGSSKTQ